MGHARLGRGFLAVWGLINLIHVIPWLALCVRRLHDVNRSGLWLLAGLIPIAGFIFLLICAVMPSTPEGARFDREVAQRGESRRSAGGSGPASTEVWIATTAGPVRDAPAPPSSCVMRQRMPRMPRVIVRDSAKVITPMPIVIAPSVPKYTASESAL